MDPRHQLCRIPNIAHSRTRIRIIANSRIRIKMHWIRNTANVKQHVCADDNEKVVVPFVPVLVSIYLCITCTVSKDNNNNNTKF